MALTREVSTRKGLIHIELWVSVSLLQQQQLLISFFRLSLTLIYNFFYRSSICLSLISNIKCEFQLLNIIEITFVFPGVNSQIFKYGTTGIYFLENRAILYVNGNIEKKVVGCQFNLMAARSYQKNISYFSVVSRKLLTPRTWLYFP